MERDFETVMIEQCAPVLAGLKPAGLFRYETRNRADLARRVAGWNAQLNPKGLQVRVLRGCIATRQYLVYVYRAAKLQTVLADAAVRGFLAREGYRLPEDAADCNALLDQLSLRLCCAAEAADSPTRSGYFWAIRWRMWWALSATGASALPAAGAGSPTATPPPPGSTLTSWPSARRCTCGCSTAARPF